MVRADRALAVRVTQCNSHIFSVQNKFVNRLAGVIICLKTLRRTMHAHERILRAVWTHILMQSQIAKRTVFAANVFY